eukprot:scaffold113443_cov19-Tisochrysis_lutea.AAC.3
MKLGSFCKAIRVLAKASGALCQGNEGACYLHMAAPLACLGYCLLVSPGCVCACAGTEGVSRLLVQAWALQVMQKTAMSRDA